MHQDQHQATQQALMSAEKTRSTHLSCGIVGRSRKWFLCFLLFAQNSKEEKKWIKAGQSAEITQPAWRHVVLSPMTLPFFGFILTHSDLSDIGLAAPAFQQSREKWRQREISNEKRASSNRDMVFVIVGK